MLPPQTRLDPEGLYARLGVPPSAPPDAITAAFRRKARMLHPDIPGTGDTDAFVAARQAYDVLANPQRRASYDRQARRAALETMEVGEIEPGPPFAMAAAPTRHPRLSDLPWGLWVGGALVICLGVVEAALHLSARVDPVAMPTPRAGHPPIAAPAPQAASGMPGASSPVASMAPTQLAGIPNYYIVPAAGPTVLWRLDPTRNAFVPNGQVPPFTAVQALRLFRQNGLVEVRVTETSTGLVEASRLAPGDAAAARRAYCAYNAGPLPDNGEVLERHGQGSGSLDVTNRTAQPAVVKLRDGAGGVAASVFLAPGGHARVTALPGGTFRPDFAIGEMWSRACNSFAAGMRAQRFPALMPLTTLSPMAIPPNTSGSEAPLDIPDHLFEAE
ncbi:MAG: J domain-containing protein [Acetobacteraceae bacterium]|nr:J domain-containing protein [Acetobacteraceae bacterium]